MVLRSLIIGTLLMGAAIPFAHAHVLENMGFAKELDALPQVYDVPPIADQDIQRMAIDMKNADCEQLIQLEEHVREAFLITQLYLQREGSLSKIVRPNCTFLGQVEKVAEISDPSLTIGGNRESMYYLGDMHAILVSHEDRDTVAYGMFYHGDDPVNFFLEHRRDAERAAAIAELFSDTIGQMEPPVEALPETSSTIVIVSSSSSSSSSSFAPTATASSAPASVFTTQSAQPPLGRTSAASAISTVATDTGSEAANTGSSEAALSAKSVPNIEPNVVPIGPEPPPPEQQRGWMLWLALALFTLIAGTLVAVFVTMRRKTAAEQRPKG